MTLKTCRVSDLPRASKATLFPRTSVHPGKLFCEETRDREDARRPGAKTPRVGRQPAEMTRAALMRPFSVEWSGQNKAFGLPIRD